VIGPTNVQLRTLKFIQSFTESNGVCPTLREICEYFGISSTNGANDRLLGLIRKGLITKGERDRSRTIVVTEAGLALLGRTRKPIPPIIHYTEPTKCVDCGATLFTLTCPMCRAELRELKKAAGRT